MSFVAKLIDLLLAKIAVSISRYCDDVYPMLKAHLRLCMNLIVLIYGPFHNLSVQDEMSARFPSRGLRRAV